MNFSLFDFVGMEFSKIIYPATVNHLEWPLPIKFNIVIISKNYILYLSDLADLLIVKN